MLHYPLLIVHYEDIRDDKLREVERMLQFLKFQYNRTELAAKLREDFDELKRHHTEDFDHYTATQRNYVQSIMEEVKEWLQSVELSTESFEKYLCQC